MLSCRGGGRRLGRQLRRWSAASAAERQAKAAAVREATRHWSLMCEPSTNIFSSSSPRFSLQCAQQAAAAWRCAACSGPHGGAHVWGPRGACRVCGLWAFCVCDVLGGAASVSVAFFLLAICVLHMPFVMFFSYLALCCFPLISEQHVK